MTSSLNISYYQDKKSAFSDPSGIFRGYYRHVLQSVGFYLFIYFNFKLRVERKEYLSPSCLWGADT